MGRPGPWGVLPPDRPPPGSLSCPGGLWARSPPCSASQVVGELDLPASRGCCAAAATSATAALRRRRRAGEAAPRESRARPGLGPRREITVFTEASAGPWGRVIAGALPYLPGAAQTLSGSGERRDLIMYLSRVAWFPPGAAGAGGRGLHEFPKGAGACSGMGWVAAAEWEAYIF